MNRPRVPWRPGLISVLFYAGVGVVMGRRVVTALGSGIASDPGDPVLNAAILSWNAQHVPWTDAWLQFPIFYPTADALTLSEHLLGVSLIASPIHWLAGNAAAAYNLTLLLSYPLSGLTMYALVWRLTRRPSAAFLAGLAFAFAPYRASQLPHIQMLTVFWAPLALLGLHAFLETGRRRWLILFALSWGLQGAANGYLLVYFSILVALWVLWFLVARRRWRDAALVVAAGAVALVPLVPILYRYIAAHRQLGLTRNLGEIASFGSDIAAPLCASDRLTFWGWLRVSCAQEGELFVGATLLALLLAGLFEPRRSRRPDAGNNLRVLRGIRLVAVAIAVVFLTIAASVIVIGPWRVDFGWLRASASSADKPTSTALAFLLIAFVLSDRFRAGVARGSVTTFYAGAAIVCWVLSWGPFPRLFGAEALYQAPYAWLLQLPGVGGLRVPARFWMMTVLCLSVLAGFAAAELLRGRTRRVSMSVVAFAACGLLIDGWVTIPVAALPPPVANAASLRGAPVLVLPVGELEHDVGVVYHAVAGGWTSINGFSGYEPGHYEALRTLSQAGDSAMFEPFLRLGDIHVVESGAGRRLRARSGDPVSRNASAFRDAAPALGQRHAVRGRSASCSPDSLAYATDGDMETQWVCGVQNADHEITLDLGSVADVGAIIHALGSFGADFPRHLIVETSTDAIAWNPAWAGSPADRVLAAAMEMPRSTRVVIPFIPRPAQYLRLRQTGRHERNYWSIAELEVWSGL